MSEYKSDTAPIGRMSILEDRCGICGGGWPPGVKIVCLVGSGDERPAHLYCKMRKMSERAEARKAK